MNRVPLMHRWALVTRDSSGVATVLSSHYTYRAARRAKLLDDMDRRTTWNPHRPPEVEPTDWAPRTRRQMRVLQILADHGTLSATALSAYTAMSPRTVEAILLDLGRCGWAVHRTIAIVGAGADRAPEGVWRLLSPDEWTGLPR